MKTRFTELVGCDLPLQLATLGGVGTAELAAAVASAGGLGMVPAGIEPPAPPPGGAVGVGFLMPFGPSRDDVASVARSVRVVEFFYADPRADLVAEAHAAGALCAWQVGSVAEAAAAEAAGCDFVVAQGSEAGGHVRGTLPLRELLGTVLERVRVPVVAAGGIATREGVAAALAAGADAVRIGTRFVATFESGAHPEYLQALVRAEGPQDTVLTTHFDDGWPGAPHRVLKGALERARATGCRTVTPPHRWVEGDVSGMAMYAGEGVGAINSVVGAREVALEVMGEDRRPPGS